MYFYNARWYDPSLGRFIQPDSMVPNPGNPQDWNRYAYVMDNPINRTDSTGHWPEWINTVGQLSQGFSYEFIRTNNWLGAIVSPDAAKALEPNSTESDAMLIGRIVADVVTIGIGVAEVAGGIGIAGGGAAVGCGVTLCVASAPAAVAGIAIAGYGVGTTISGAAALGDNLGRVYSSRSENKLRPDSSATGPHSTFRRDPETGKVTNYETYRPQTNPNNPNFWERILRYDGVGKAHRETTSGNKILPHVHDFIERLVRNPYFTEIPK